MPKPAPPPPELSYTITVNGQTQMLPRGPGHALPARYIIAPGEDLAITVEAAVPAHVTVTGLWLGIMNGVLTFRPDGSPSVSV